MTWMTWSRLLFKLIIDCEKNSRRKKKKISEKINIIKTKIKKIMNNQWIKNISIIKKQKYSKMNIKKNYIFIMRKKTSSQKMQKFITRKISKNMSMNNYNNRTMWKKMMSDDNMSAILFKTKHD